MSNYRAIQKQVPDSLNSLITMTPRNHVKIPQAQRIIRGQKILQQLP